METVKALPPACEAYPAKPCSPSEWLPSALSDKLFQEAWNRVKWSLAEASPTADYENAKLFWDRAWKMSRIALSENTKGLRTRHLVAGTQHHLVGISTEKGEGE